MKCTRFFTHALGWVVIGVEGGVFVQSDFIHPNIVHCLTCKTVANDDKPENILIMRAALLIGSVIYIILIYLFLFIITSSCFVICKYMLELGPIQFAGSFVRGFKIRIVN